MSIRTQPHSVVSAEVLAKWIEDQPDRWWSVDGDPRLMGTVDFPCPSDELAPAIRGVGKDLLVALRKGSDSRGVARIDAPELEEYVETFRGQPWKIVRLAWVDLDLDWLLLEEEAMVA